MREIPKIIHQVWSGIDEPLPTHYEELGNTWKEKNPDWEYVIWDNQKMTDFVLEHYPHYWSTYNSFKCNIQRWDAIRYLILDKIGGVYADFDTECLKPLETLLKDRECCFSFEPEVYQQYYGGVPFYFNNAFMASTPDHPFMKKAIERAFYYDPTWRNAKDILGTTGPLMLIHLYQGYEEKENIYLIPPQLTSPITREEGISRINGNNTEEIENKLKDAYVIHYFFSAWVDQVDA